MDTTPVAVREHFTRFIAERGAFGPIGAAAEALVEGVELPLPIDDRADLSGVDRRSMALRERLDLILGYVAQRRPTVPSIGALALEVRWMKRLLFIEEGSFYALRRSEVALVLAAELDPILEDYRIEDAEDLQLFELQAAFDLSYDQYLELVSGPVQHAMFMLVARGNLSGRDASEARAKAGELWTMFELTRRHRPVAPASA